MGTFALLLSLCSYETLRFCTTFSALECDRDYFAKAEEGIDMLAPDARLPVRASMDIYSGILNQLEENGFDNFTKRAFVPKLKKLSLLPLCWLRVQREEPFQSIYELLGKP